MEGFRSVQKAPAPNPGPACYRRGGPLTITDCNVMLGRCRLNIFRRSLDRAETRPLDAQSCAQKFAALAPEVAAVDRRVLEAPEEIAEGFLRIAIDNMANAIKKISVQRGHDVTGYALQCFGGAGGQHACGVADALGMKSVFIHPLAGVLSAFGMGLAHLRALAGNAVRCAAVRRSPKLAVPGSKRLRPRRVADLRRRDRQADGLCKPRICGMRDSIKSLPVPFGDDDRNGTRVRRRTSGPVRLHLARAGHPVRDACGAKPRAEARTLPDLCAERSAGQPVERLRVWAGGQWQSVPLYRREACGTATRILRACGDHRSDGDDVVEPGWEARVDGQANLILRRVECCGAASRGGNGSRPGAAGGVQQPVHVGRRPDGRDAGEYILVGQHQGKARFFLCDLRCRVGTLVANAPHVPVHLGSMSHAVKTVIAAVGTHGAGGRRMDAECAVEWWDASAGRDCDHSGFRGWDERPSGWARVGIMPTSGDVRRARPRLTARRIEEEGVVIDLFPLVARHTLHEAETRVASGFGAVAVPVNRSEHGGPEGAGCRE